MRNPYVPILLCLQIITVVRAVLRPESELSTNCFNFPADNFDKINSVKGTYGSSPHLVLDTGAQAIDFTLHDIDGNPWNLADTLRNGQGKPIALIWGMSTCPAYQGLGSEGSSSRWSYWNEIDLVRFSASSRSLGGWQYDDEIV